MRRFTAILLFAVCLMQAPPLVFAAVPTRPNAMLGLAPAAPPANDGADLDALIKLLQDDKARAHLIERLKNTASGQKEVPPPEPLAMHLAGFSTLLFQHLRSFLSVGQNALHELLGVLHGTSRLLSWRVWTAFCNMAGVALATFAVFYMLRWSTARVARPLLLHRPGSFAGKIIRLLSIIALDTGTVAAAWATGHGLAMLIDEGGVITAGQTLFLQAFLQVELFKAALRGIFAPRLPHLRFLKLSSASEANHSVRFWYGWLAGCATVFGYSFLMAIPLLATVSTDGSRSLETLLVLSALITACWLAVLCRQEGRLALIKLTNHGSPDAASDIIAQIGALLGAVWHVLVIVWMAALFLCWLSAPMLLPFMLHATGYSIVALLVGGFALNRLSVLHDDIAVPDKLKRSVPLLHLWLKRLIAPLRKALRLMVMLTVILALLQVWDAVDVLGWLQTDAGKFTLSVAVSVILVLGCGAAIYLLVASWIERRLLLGEEQGLTSRERTLLSLFKNAFSIGMVVIVVLAILSQLGVNTAPLLAGAGVFGLAIGFGSQKLVQDIINGMFIQFENAMNEGDVVEAGGVLGKVEKLTIRSVGIRSIDGIYHLIPFSSVDRVSNHNRIFSMHAAVVRVGHRASIPDTKQAMLDAFDRLMQTEHAHAIIGALDMQGVIDLSPAIISIRARIKTLPGEQWVIGRAYNEIVKTVLEERGIEIAVPGMRLYLDELPQKNAAAISPLEMLKGYDDKK